MRANRLAAVLSIAALGAAGATDVRIVTWGAPGAQVILHSGCARGAVVDFLDDPDAAEQSTACPS